MNIPQRWQRSRKAGAKQPASCRYVGRGTNYGNDYQIFTVLSKGHPEFWYVKNNITKYMSLPLSERLAHVHSVDMFKNIQMKIIIGGVPTYYDYLLQFEYISCFCSMDMPCHCDAIIEHLKERIKVLA